MGQFFVEGPAAKDLLQFVGTNNVDTLEDGKAQYTCMPNGNGGEHLMGLPLRDAREVFEREYLVAQISRFGGNISRTAEFVGMERSALHRKLKALGID